MSIINSFPKESPNNVLENIEYSPHYSTESFDSIVDILNYQIEDYKRLFENKSINIDAKNHNETQIRKREYAIEQVLKIKEDYCNARDAYRTFCKTKKMVLDLYAGQAVKIILSSLRCLFIMFSFQGIISMMFMIPDIIRLK